MCNINKYFSYYVLQNQCSPYILHTLHVKSRYRFLRTGSLIQINCNFYNDSNPTFQEFFPTIPSAISPWFFCQVFVMFSVPLPKMPSAVVPIMICHTLTAFPLLNCIHTVILTFFHCGSGCTGATLYFLIIESCFGFSSPL